MVIAPTQNTRDAVTKPSAREISFPPFLKRFSSPVAKRFSFSSKSNPSPMIIPMAIERISTSVFSPFSVPLQPMYNVQSPRPFINVSVILSGIPFFNNKPMALPISTVRVFTMTAIIFSPLFFRDVMYESVPLFDVFVHK